MKQFQAYRFSFLRLFLFLALSSQLILAQNAKDDWSNVQSIKQGSSLAVKTKKGQKFQGKLKAVADDSLTLLDAKNPGQEVAVKKEEIAEIRKKSGAQTAGMAALVGGLGFAGGYGIGYGIGAAKNARFRPEYPTAAVGAGVGAIVGALIGNKGRIVYKTP